MINIEGKLIEKFETVQVTDTFKKREFVIEHAENPSYPEFLKLELIQDKCNSLDNIEIGETINVFINIKGRKWTNKEGKVNYFNSLQAWKIESENQNYNQEFDQNEKERFNQENNTEELPF